jgi:YHS domain-containing protein
MGPGNYVAIQSFSMNHVIARRNATMKESKTLTKDPICGMSVDEGTAIHAERDGKTSYFCSEHCREKFLSLPAGAKPENKDKGCCGG